VDGGRSGVLHLSRMENTDGTRVKRKFRRLHQSKCGERERYECDTYADVRMACERKLAEWEREGILLPYNADRVKDWLFC